MSETYPSEIVVDNRKETKSVVASPEIEAALPHVTEAFAKVDQTFLENPRAYYERLQDSVFTFKSHTGKEIACSLLYDEDSKKDELERYQKFNGVLGSNGHTIIKKPSIDLRAYAKYVLQEGTREEKREILKYVSGELYLKDQKVHIERKTRSKKFS